MTALPAISSGHTALCVSAGASRSAHRQRGAANSPGLAGCAHTTHRKRLPSGPAVTGQRPGVSAAIAANRDRDAAWTADAGHGIKTARTGNGQGISTPAAHSTRTGQRPGPAHSTWSSITTQRQGMAAPSRHRGSIAPTAGAGHRHHHRAPRGHHGQSRIDHHPTGHGDPANGQIQ